MHSGLVDELYGLHITFADMRNFLVGAVEDSRFRQLVAFCFLPLLGKGEFK